jgi:hypothetical protein
MACRWRLPAMEVASSVEHSRYCHQSNRTQNTEHQSIRRKKLAAVNQRAQVWRAGSKTQRQPTTYSMCGNCTCSAAHVCESRKQLQGQANLTTSRKPCYPLNWGHGRTQSRSGSFGEAIRTPDCSARSLITILSYLGSTVISEDRNIIFTIVNTSNLTFANLHECLKSRHPILVYI